MKKTYLLIGLILFSSVFSFSQKRRTPTTVKWFSIAAKAGVGNSYFFNSDHINDQDVQLNMYSLSTSFGGRLTFTYGDNLGFGSDVLVSSYNQKYNIRNNETVYDKNIKINTLDILPFFRYTGFNTAYVEVGAKISKINAVSEENSVIEPFNSLTTDIFEPKFTSAVLGFGLAVFKTDRIDINLGARLAYSFTDLCPNQNLTNDGFYIPDYTMTATTNPMSLQAVFEVNYFFAFWGDAKCGRGRLMLFQ